MSEETSDFVLCRASVELPLSADNGELMYLPGGEHAIFPFGGGIGKAINIQIDASSAAELEAERAAIRKTPYFDFNHDDKDASFWPSKFVWRDGEKPGVYAQGEWSERGKRSVTGKAYKYFSPVFFVDNKHATPAKVVCRKTAAPNMGGLTNDPAFHQILPLWAKSGAGHDSATLEHKTSEPQPKGKQMDNPEELAALQAKQKELETQIKDLESKVEAQRNTGDPSDDALAAAESELRATVSELRATQQATENAELKAAAAKRNRTDAEAAVKAKILSGAILPKDIAFQKRLIDMATEDPSLIRSLIEKLPGNEALQDRVTRFDGGGGGYIGGQLRIAAEDPIMVFGEMGKIVSRQMRCTHLEKARCSRDLAQIYATELAPELNGLKPARLLAMPVSELETALMATDVTDGSLGTLAGVLVTQRTLELLKFSFPALSAFTTDFTSDGATYGQTVITRTVTVPNVITYNTTTGWAASTAANTDVPVTLDSHHGVVIEFNEQILASTMRRLFEEFAPASAYALAKDMVDDLYANITDANFTNNTVATVGAFARASVSATGTALDIRGVPSGLGMRTMSRYPTFYEKIVNDTIIATMGAYSRNELITNPTNGVELAIPIDSFRIIKAPNMPTNNGNVTGFAGSKSALCIVTRTPNDYTTVLPGANNGNVQMVTDPDLGITVMLVQFVNHTLGRAQSRIALMFGTAAGQGSAGQLIKGEVWFGQQPNELRV